VASMPVRLALLARQSPRLQPADGLAATVMRWTLWILPLGVLVSGVFFPFPIATLLFGLTNSTWTLRWQWFVHRTPPEPAPRPVPQSAPEPVSGVRERRDGQVAPTSCFGAPFQQTPPLNIRGSTLWRGAAVRKGKSGVAAAADPFRGRGRRPGRSSACRESRKLGAQPQPLRRDPEAGLGEHVG
jgi:hypothetical protein